MEEEISSDEPKSDELFQKLRDWQHQQHQRLIEQQQQQRLMLLNQQKQLLSRINSGSAQETSCDYDIIMSPNQRDTNQVSDSRNVVNSPIHRVDDVPLKKPRSVKTFQQILENSLTKQEQQEVAHNEQPKKFPFLKRGQGISRFGAVSRPTKRIPPCKRAGKENKKISAAQESDNLKTLNPESCNYPHNTAKPERATSKTETTAYSQLVSFQPVTNVISKTAPTSSQLVPETNIDEINKRDRGEVNSSRHGEDLAVFELLERFATINASFSSSSSLIGQLIERGVTHLPSPSKVIDFLSHKQHLDIAEEEQIPKLPRANKHVHFSDSLDENPATAESQSHPSPFVSNTLASGIHQFDETDPELENPNFNETPLSPIGFPDFQKLFGNKPPEKPESLPNPNLASNGIPTFPLAYFIWQLNLKVTFSL